MRILSIKLLLAGGLLAMLPLVASADTSFYQGEIFGIEAAHDGTLLVADIAQGVVDGDDGSLIADLPGVGDIAARADGGMWAIAFTEEGSMLFSIVDGDARPVANLAAFEEKHDPHPGDVNPNPFEVVDLGRGEALVADAGGNDLLKINKHGKVKLVAVFPNELVSTQHAKDLAGCPTPPVPELEEICALPPMIPAEPVTTSVAVGPDGAYYVGELKGFPGPVGESRVWRVEPNARNAKCGQSPKCSVVFDGFTSIIDMKFGPDGRLYIAQLEDNSWLAESPEVSEGGSVHACDLATGDCEEVASGIPILTAITFRGDDLWGSILALIPGQTDVVPLTP